ncbi:hypothetical protein GBA52_019624 [Prunus armeniaca]|nr:hypothetical protein GBA52_019624 [Prunus armeniaca]
MAHRKKKERRDKEIKRKKKTGAEKEEEKKKIKETDRKERSKGKKKERESLLELIIKWYFRNNGRWKDMFCVFQISIVGEKIRWVGKYDKWWK